jgi:hypothetical protein
MERSRGMKRAAGTTLKALILAAAIASTGCSGNALMNPVSTDTAQGQQTAQNLSGHGMNPAGNNVRP